MDPNSYLAIAYRNIETNKKMLEWGDYNDSVRYSQQVVEKVLKHLLETTCDAEVTKFMKLHKLKILYSEVMKKNIKELPEVNTDTLAALTDYYFDTNYPGDNFVLVEKEEAERMYLFARNFIDTFKKLSESVKEDTDFPTSNNC